MRVIPRVKHWAVAAAVEEAVVVEAAVLASASDRALDWERVCWGW